MSTSPYINEDVPLKFLDRKLWLRMMKLVKGHRIMLVVAFLALVVAELLPQFQPRILRDIVDGPIQTGNVSELLQKCLLFLVLVLVSFFLRYIATVLSQVMALKIIHKLRTSLFQHISGLHADFFKRTPVGRLMTRLTGDIDSINSMFAEGLVELAGALLMLVFPVIFMYSLNPVLATVTLMITPFLILATHIFRVKVRDVNTVIRTHVAELNTRMQEILSGNPILQLFGKSAQMWQVFNATNNKLKNLWLQNVRYYAVYFPVVGGITEMSIVVLYFIGTWMFFRDQVSVGTLMAFSWYMSMFWRPLREISDQFTQLQAALAASERVFTLFEVKNPLPSGTEQPKSNFELEFKDVSFAYESEQWVLKNINLKVQAGETLALVGATGSGKSTLLQLACGSYRAQTGQVLVGSQNINELDLQLLSQHMAIIPQDVYLYSQSIEFNICLSETFDQFKLESACRAVGIHDWILTLEQGYKTLLRSRGENLSTGQRQLIAFARALYHKPAFLLLDEATSSIDTESEIKIQKALQTLTQGVTSLIVAHRLSTIRNAHRIVVLH